MENFSYNYKLEEEIEKEIKNLKLSKKHGRAFRKSIIEIQKREKIEKKLKNKIASKTLF